MGILLIVLLVLLTLFPILVLIFIIIPFLFGASFEISTRPVIRKMIEFSKVKKGEKVTDLGSGDGRVVIEFAKRGIEVHGYEINPILVWWSRYKIRKEGLGDRAFIHWENFWNVNLKEYDVVIVFQISYLMLKIARKLREELKSGSRIISNKWKIRNWPIDEESGVGTGVYLYRV